MASACIQCWGMFLSWSKEDSNADGLSRLHLGKILDTTRLFWVSFVDVLPITAEDIAVETSKDKQLS